MPFGRSKLMTLLLEKELAKLVCYTKLNIFCVFSFFSEHLSILVLIKQNKEEVHTVSTIALHAWRNSKLDSKLEDKTEQYDLSPAWSWVWEQMTFGCPFQSTSLYEIKLSSCKVEHCSQERGDESFPPLLPFSSCLRARPLSFLLKEKKEEK